MLSAFLTLPLVYVSYKLENKADLITIIVQTVITLSGAVLFTFIVLYLMKFIHAFFKFHRVDRNLLLLIVANIVVAVLTAAQSSVNHTAHVDGTFRRINSGKAATFGFSYVHIS